MYVYIGILDLGTTEPIDTKLYTVPLYRLVNHNGWHVNFVSAHKIKETCV